jgi:FG-GAP-like repeat
VASPVFNSSLGLSLADIDGDGVLDVVNANEANAFSVLKGNGAGSFGPGAVYGVSSPTAGEVEEVGTADFDGDGLDDVVVTSRFSHGSGSPTYQVNVFTHTPVSGKVSGNQCYDKF